MLKFVFSGHGIRNIFSPLVGLKRCFTVILFIKRACGQQVRLEVDVIKIYRLNRCSLNQYERLLAMSVDRCQLSVELRGKPNDFREISFHLVNSYTCKFSIDSGCTNKNPPQSPFAKGGSSRNARTY